PDLDTTSVSAAVLGTPALYKDRSMRTGNIRVIDKNASQIVTPILASPSTGSLDGDGSGARLRQDLASNTGAPTTDINTNVVGGGSAGFSNERNRAASLCFDQGFMEEDA